MCRYCKSGSAEPLFDFSTKGDIRINSYGLITGSDENGMELTVSIFNQDTEVRSKEIKIKFCPMCGRKLKSIENKES